MDILSDIVLVLGLSVLVIYLFHILKMPAILGFLITGVIVGPSVLGLIEASHEVELLAEIGVILLLFVIGIEFSLKTLSAIKRTVFIGGLSQVFLTILVVTLIAWLGGLDVGQAVFLSFLVSLSSTAIVLKILQERGEIATAAGRTAVAILIFQDIIVVPMMLFTPILSGQESNILQAVLVMTLKGAAMIVFVLVSARYLVPWLLDKIAKTRVNELFLLSIVVICFAVAWLSYSIGLSLALGAFMAGLIISETDYHYHATSYIQPFHEIFTSFFFVSIGMLLDLNFLTENLPVILGLTVLVLLLKTVTASLAGFFLKFQRQVSLQIGMSLNQIGEFSFILSATGITYGLIGDDLYQYFLAVSILTMAVTPFSIIFSQRLAGKVKKKLATPDPLPREEIEEHIVIIGFGLNGRNVAKAARQANIPYLILELNAATVRKEKQNGEPIYFGDATNPGMLGHLKIHKARVAVIAISDSAAMRKIVSHVRQFSPRTHIIARTRYVQDLEELHKLGADEVIPEEFETSIEIFNRVLNHYLVPRDDIEKFTNSIRSGNYEIFRAVSGRNQFRDPLITSLDLEMAALKVNRENPEIIGKKLKDSRLRQEYGVNLVGLRRGEKFIAEIDGDLVIEPDDLVYMIGKPSAITNFSQKIMLPQV
jgi:CPA2 family monovalent cation:H+ antiporter-2